MTGLVDKVGKVENVGKASGSKGTGKKGNKYIDNLPRIKELELN